MDFNIDFSKSVVPKGKKSGTVRKSPKGKKEIPKDGFEVKFSANDSKLYVDIDEVRHNICNHLQLTGQLEVKVYSIPGKNDAHEDWYESTIDSDMLFDRLDKLKAWWASFKEGSIVGGTVMGNEFAVSKLYEV